MLALDLFQEADPLIANGPPAPTLPCATVAPESFENLTALQKGVRREVKKAKAEAAAKKKSKGGDTEAAEAGDGSKAASGSAEGKPKAKSRSAKAKAKGKAKSDTSGTELQAATNASTLEKAPMVPAQNTTTESMSTATNSKPPPTPCKIRNPHGTPKHLQMKKKRQAKAMAALSKLQRQKQVLQGLKDLVLPAEKFEGQRLGD